MTKITDLITGEQIVVWIIIAVLVVYFVYKEWPEFKKRVTKKPLDEQEQEMNDRTVLSRLDMIEADQKSIKLDIKEINEKLQRDYERINQIDQIDKHFEEMFKDSLKERGIMMDAMLGVLGGLQELGANGPTKEAEARIKSYMNEKVHEL